jgi:hypothetical protein
LRSTKVSGLPGVKSKRASGRFALVDENGKPVYVFYPFTNKDSQEKRDDDIGFVLWNAPANKFELINQKLGQTPFVNEPSFVSLENSVSQIPHYIK